MTTLMMQGEIMEYMSTETDRDVDQLTAPASSRPRE
jgi:hypothetical protein